MRAGALRKPRHGAPIELHPIHVDADVTSFGTREVHPAVAFVDAVDGPDIPLATSDWCSKGPIGFVAIEMLPTRTIADPQERAVLEPPHCSVDIDPSLGRLPEQRQRPCAAGRHRVDVEPRLLAILNLIHHSMAVRRPVHVDDQEIGGRILRQIHPLHMAAHRGQHPELHDGVRVSGLGVIPLFDTESRWDVIDDREFRHGTVVDLHEGDLRRVGTPPIGAEVTAPEDLLLIDPIELAIEKLVGAAGGELFFLALLLEIHDEQVVTSNERSLSSVRAERVLLFLVRIKRQTKRAVAAEGVVVQVIANRNERRAVRGVHFQPRIVRQHLDVFLAQAG